MNMRTKNISLKLILSVIALGIWIIVLQNTGIIPITQRVKVINEIDANITNAINAEISGSVSVDNVVDVNIHEINGYNQVTTKIGTHSVFPFGYMLPVDNW